MWIVSGIHLKWFREYTSAIMRLLRFFAVAIGTLPIFAQQKPPDANRIADCLIRIRQHNLGSGIVDEASYIEPLARAHVTQAIFDLEALFAGSKDVEERAEIASALVRLGDKDEGYWNLLVTYATPALETDLPFPFDLSTPDSASGKPSPAFLAAAKAHHLSPEAAMALVLTDLPVRLTYLAKTGDPRAIPLLRKALQSPNISIRQIAASGLSECQDKASIPVIIEMCRKAPAMESHMLAYSLMFFNDVEAQNAAQRYYLTDGQDIHKVKEFVGPHAFVW
jgi:hypothetical protein